MDTLLVAAGSDPALSRQLAKSAAIVRRQIPALGSEIEVVHEFLPEAGVGWYYVLPRPAPVRPLITVYSDERHTFLVYGEFFDAHRHTPPAKVVREAWTLEGIRAVQQLNGSFSAIVIDRRHGIVDVVSDPLGRRSLRSYRQPGSLLISTHDVPLVATGQFVPRTDLASAAAIIGCDWSIGGYSLLHDVEVCSPSDALHWEDGELRTQRVPRMAFARGRAVDAAAHRESMLETFVSGTASLMKGVSQVEVELTAGLDSRAVLAAAMQSIGPDGLTLVTRGQAGDVEVATAQTIARRYGLGHRVQSEAAFSVEAVAENCRALAYFMNGDTNSKRALAPSFTYAADAPLSLGGAGGEIYRGYYYPRQRRPSDGRFCASEALPVLRAKMKRLRTLPWTDPSIADRVHWRLDETVGDLIADADTGFDVLDLFYLHERFGRWALGARLPTEESRLFPFENLNLIRLALELPSPMKSHCDLQRTAVRRYLAKAWWLPINGHRRLPLEHLPAGRWLQRVLNRAARSVPSHPTRRGRDDWEASRANLLKGPCLELCRELLNSPQGIGRELLGRAELQRLLDEHSAGTFNHIQVLGFLLTLETWREMIAETHQIAMSAEPVQASVAMGSRP